MRLTWIRKQPKTKGQQNLQGQQAKALLSNEAFQAAMEDIENHYVVMWKDSPAMADQEREKLYLALQVIKKLKSTLANYYQDFIVNQENGRLDADREQMKQKLNKTL